MVGRRSSRTSNDGAVRAALASIVAAIDRGAFPQAERLLQETLHLEPDHPDLLHLAGVVAMARGDIDEAVDLIRKAIRRFGKAPVYHYNLGLALSQRGEFEAAARAFQKAIRLGQADHDVYKNLGIAHQQAGRLGEAEKVFESATRQFPGDVVAWLNLAKIRIELGDAEGVALALGEARKLAADDAVVWRDIANLYLTLGRLEEAASACDGGLRTAPDDGSLWYLKGHVFYESSRHLSAEDAYDRALAEGFDQLKVRLAQARLLLTSGRLSEGRALLADLRGEEGLSVEVLGGMALLYSLIGDFREEEACLRAMLEKDPKNLAAQAALSFVPGRSLTAEAVRSLERYLRDPSVPVRDRCTAGFALGNHYRGAGDVDRAFRCYRQANRLKSVSWDRRGYGEWVARTLELCGERFFRERSDWGSASGRPLLIVGMPRSGTTLVEQILSSHSRIHGAGELGGVATLASRPGREAPAITENAEALLALDRDAVKTYAEGYLERLEQQDAEAKAIIANKLPTNFQQLGLFGLLFPGAPVIHVRRDPRDNLLSIYFQDFEGYHPYAYDLENLAYMYWQQHRLMEHWKQVLPNPIFTVNYEDLVSDLEGEIARLAAFLHLEMEDGMKRFHEQERQVKTASKWQVRQKLYTTSIGRWKPYEKHLRPLFDALREFAPEDYVDEYGFFSS